MKEKLTVYPSGIENSGRRVKDGQTIFGKMLSSKNSLIKMRMGRI
jgi:hypothetical protein